MQGSEFDLPPNLDDPLVVNHDPDYNKIVVILNIHLINLVIKRKLPSPINI
jgi:hypothetical protein